MKYIWQANLWPKFSWNGEKLLSALSDARFAQGKFIGLIKTLGFKLGDEAQANILTEETIKTSAIEGEKLNPQSVRSSVARHLGLSSAGLVAATRSIDGLVQVILDATQNYNKPFSAVRIKGWQAALFPTGYSGLHKIKVGKWRGDEPMRVVSGPIGREKIHFEAPPGKDLDLEMGKFFDWWDESKNSMDGLLRAALAHFYFVTIHPFEDGNGRIARAITDMALAQDEKMKIRYYSLSSQIMEERDEYYNILEKCSKTDNMDITKWFLWFLGCFTRAIKKSEEITGNILAKAYYWSEHSQVQLNERQKKVLNRLLDAGEGNFEGGLTTRKYASIAKVSRATAFRELSDMLSKKLLCQLIGKGRNVRYDLVWPNINKKK